jgi:hypothetical protein
MHAFRISAASRYAREIEKLASTLVHACALGKNAGAEEEGQRTCCCSLAALLAPNTLWMAANCAAPSSAQKWGANTHSAAHLRLRNLHAPHGDPGVPPLPEDAMAPAAAAAVNA